jgi:hypothetical protein
MKIGILGTGKVGNALGTKARSNRKRSDDGFAQSQQRLWYGEPDAISNAIGHANFFSRSPML